MTLTEHADHVARLRDALDCRSEGIADSAEMLETGIGLDLSPDQATALADRLERAAEAHAEAAQ